jgi:hypothetical protein
LNFVLHYGSHWPEGSCGDYESCCLLCHVGGIEHFLQIYPRPPTIPAPPCFLPLLSVRGTCQKDEPNLLFPSSAFTDGVCSPLGRVGGTGNAVSLFFSVLNWIIMELSGLCRNAWSRRTICIGWGVRVWVVRPRVSFVHSYAHSSWACCLTSVFSVDWRRSKEGNLGAMLLKSIWTRRPLQSLIYRYPIATFA